MRVFVLLALCALTVAAHANPFFAFDNGVGRGVWTPEQQADCLAELGYGGISYQDEVDLDTRLAAFDARGLKIFNVYVPCHVDKEPAFSEELVRAIARLKGTGVDLWLTVQGQAEDDVKAVTAIQAIADLAAASGIRVALYPHAGFHVATLDDALRVVAQVERDNVGVTFNLCHELKAGNGARIDEILEKAAPRLFFVSINGAEHDGDWDRLIQPLGEGAFDVYGVLKKLKSLGYTGPVGLQCYNVKGDTRGNLEKSMAAWKAYGERLRAEQR
ncbi:MAG: TIM barrel protein [Candidatus Hydrogenedentes bacterium]|nr:TIM barrel protein [Candidatus Hydrogenedentota bacterium]